ncbi:hypothetical protein L6164_009831 [Bauhinia variegata]|uniref:Uncharacterized protein n=1 Tax=Bauhinia variegata TaxID=167791 RepID=A0ACB9PL80_BAUVA|nr:hypothetical protein L6164_009831 [Bauhinia variegata]
MFSVQLAGLNLDGTPPSAQPANMASNNHSLTRCEAYAFLTPSRSVRLETLKEKKGKENLSACSKVHDGGTAVILVGILDICLRVDTLVYVIT